MELWIHPETGDAVQVFFQRDLRGRRLVTTWYAVDHSNRGCVGNEEKRHLIEFHLERRGFKRLDPARPLCSASLGQTRSYDRCSRYANRSIVVGSQAFLVCGVHRRPNFLPHGSAKPVELRSRSTA